MKPTDPKLLVLERLHGMAQMIRRRGTPEEAAQVLPYEQQFAKDIETREAELKKQTQPLEVAA